MNRTPIIALALVAVARDIRAQSFTLVDGADHTLGTFTAEPSVPWVGRDGKLDPTSSQWRIVLRDRQGSEIWGAGGPVIRPLSQNVR